MRAWTKRRESSTRAFPELALVAVVGAILLFLPVAARAQEETNVDQLAEGQNLYLDNCSACHQPSGVGLAPQFPPLLDNPNVDDSDYVRGVIMNGLSGEIEVLGQTYDGVMPPFPTLDDAQIDAIVAFVQNDLVVPGAGNGEGGVPDLAGPTAGTQLPPIASAMAQLGYVVFGVVVLAVLGPRIVAVIGNRGEVSGVDAGLKAASIVVYFVAATVLLPSFVLQTEVMSRLPRGVQDFVAVAIWLGALGIGVLGLWWAQRQDRI